MTANKKGFAGFDELVSDVSEITPPANKTQKGAPSPTPSYPPQSHPEAPSATQSTQTHSTNSSGIGWIMATIAFVVVLVITTGNDKNASSSAGGYSSSPRKPVVSQYEQVIQEVDPQVLRLLDGMLEAAQSKDFQLAVKNAQSIEKDRKQIPAPDKSQLKESRSQNALGLKALKDRNKDVAVQNFFASYKLNAHDAEVAENFGIALYEIGDFQAAKKAIVASLAMTPRRSYAWVSLGRLFARNNEPVKAANAFSLGFQIAKSPRAIRQSVLSLFRDDENNAVKNAAKAFLVDSYLSTLPAFIRPVLGNLSDVKIPVFLPAKVTALNSEGGKMELVALNNEMFELEAGHDKYRIPFGSEVDCRAMYCAVGFISGQKISSTDQIEEGESVELTNGISGKIVRDTFRNASKLVFRVADIKYSMSLSADATNDTAAVISAIKLGPIPVEVFSGEARLASVVPLPVPAAPQQPTYVPPSQSYSAPVHAYVPPPAANPGFGCDITYSVSLQTFGEGVNVELRNGTPGNSRIVNSSRSFGGNVRFRDLCPGSYFLAIGNSDSVSVTPVRQFESGVEYTSTLTMQRGSGNVSTRRKGDL